MSRGFPSMTALLGLIATAGYQNRDKIAEMLRGATSSGPGASGQPQPGQSQPQNSLGGLLGNLGGAGAGGVVGGGLHELVERFRQNGQGDVAESWVGPGPNKEVAPNQLEQAIGPDVLATLSQQTGLSREDYFNWESGMRQIVEEFRPDLVFVMLGSNDAQAQISRDGTSIPVGSAQWVEGYRERAANLLREATRAGTHVVWVGIPIVEDRQRWDFYRRVNDIYRDTASADPFGTYVDTWTPFEGRDGGYTAFVRNERGDLVEVRASDGVHFTPSGYTFLGRLAIRAADQAFGMPEKTVSSHG